MLSPTEHKFMHMVKSIMVINTNLSIHHIYL